MAAQGEGLGREEFQQLLEANLQSLRTYIHLRASPELQRHEPVSDVLQSAVREIWESQETYRHVDEVSFRAFLFRVATHQLIQKARYWQAEKRRPQVLEPLSNALWELPESQGSHASRSPVGSAIRAEDIARLKHEFSQLDEQDQRLLALRRVFDVPVREIAVELGIAESTVRWRLALIETELADKLG
jgi:RNA polymerase sigma factor (sigma-70 family)